MEIDEENADQEAEMERQAGDSEWPLTSLVDDLRGEARTEAARR